MHYELLDEEKRQVLELQGSLVRTQKFFLAGGTALAMRLGRRISADLDWFTANAFDEKALIAALEKEPRVVKLCWDNEGCLTNREAVAQHQCV